jgi:hypothetical protein
MTSRLVSLGNRKIRDKEFWERYVHRVYANGNKK